ncbi:hypothetical protein [Schleiferilactobacillus shenzhenensis]|nr:hypothetical protein [Schleiferilactobacillus shenzhenensis]
MQYGALILLVIFGFWVMFDRRRTARLLYSIPRHPREFVVQCLLRAVMFILFGVMAAPNLFEGINTTGQIVVTLLWIGIYVYLAATSWRTMKRLARKS